MGDDLGAESARWPSGCCATSARTSRDTVVGVLKATATFDPKPSLAAYRGPALAVITPSNNYSFSMHRLGAGMPHRVVEGTGHWLQLDKPEEMNRILDRFLE